MNAVPVTEALNAVRFVVGSDGQAVAAQLDIVQWRALMEWLEDQQDIAEVREALARWPTGEGWSDWDDFVTELDGDEETQKVESPIPALSAAN